MTKKSFLEKLGILEPVEEAKDDERSILLGKQDFMMDDEEINAFLEESTEAGTVEVEEIVNAPSVDPFASLTAMSEVETPMVSELPEEPVVVEFKDSVIEDKLNVLIGAYEKNKMLSIEDIYRNSRLSSEIKKSIFIADVFLKTLPENLPHDIKRDSVLSILNVSNINTEELLTDAYQRIDSLNTVLENTIHTTEDIVSRNEASIRELEKRIEDIRNMSEERRKFNEDQNTLIEYEVQKIINIVEFIKPKK